MPPPDINAFRAIVLTDANLVRVDSDDVLQPKTESGNFLGWGVQLVSSTVSWALDSVLGTKLSSSEVEENNQTIEDFNHALSTEYGENIADALLLKKDGTPLSTLKIRETLLLSDLALVAAEPENDKALARALDGLVGEIQRKLPPEPQFRLLNAPLREAMQALLPVVYAMDRSPDKHLLAELGVRLAEQMNAYLLRGLAEHMGRFTEMGMKSALSEVVASLGKHDGDGLTTLCDGIPALAQHLQTERDNFVGNIKDLMARVQNDMPAIGERFCEKAPTGLLGLHITDSDPHKGGNRVCILSFDNDAKVVYKPRDVRIDEAITGCNRASDELSLFELLSLQMKEERPLPTYRFMPCQDDQGHHYGYVQCLSNGTPEDHLVTPGKAREFYYDMGRSAAVLALMGCADLHHENLMVSGGRPYFTDLEFAFEGGVGAYLSSLLTGKSDVDHLFSEMKLQDALIRGTDANHDARAPWQVHGDALEKVEPKVTSDVTESLLAVMEGEGLRDNRTDPIHQDFRQDFASGFVEALRTSRDNLEAYRRLIEHCEPFQIRQHPLDTTSQRTFFREYKNGMGDEDLGVGRVTKVLRGDLKQYAGVSGEPAEELLQPMLDAYARHDIPYFSREVGSKAMLQDGHVVVSPAYFPELPHHQSLAVLVQLGELSDKRLFEMRDEVASWMQTLKPADGLVLQDKHKALMEKIHLHVQSLEQ